MPFANKFNFHFQVFHHVCLCLLVVRRIVAPCRRVYVIFVDLRVSVMAEGDGDGDDGSFSERECHLH